jgi:hypothetical protein
MQTLFGGSSGSSGSQQSSASGFNALPPAIQNQISTLATSAGNILNPSGTPSSSLFTLPSLSQPSTNALSQIQNQDFAITPQSIQTGINEQINPYNNSVINQIEQAQNGQESQLSQYLTQAGQFGSNRGMLGASDISQQAANQIGSFLGGEYNTALQNALTTIPQNQAQSASGSVQAGQLQQQQGLQNQQAPVSALAALAQIFNTGIPATSQGQGTSSSQQSSSPGILNTLFG